MLVALIAFTALLGRFCYLIRPFDSDGSMFIYMGRLITEGGRFGHELVDNKFPTVGLITSVPWRWFGAVWWKYVVLETAMSGAMAWLLARAAGRRFGEYARVPTLLYAIVYLNFTFVVFGGFQLETIQAFFSVLAAGAFLELLGEDGDWRDALAAGLASGIAAMLKPTGLSACGAWLVAAMLFSNHRRWLKQTSWLIAGLSLPAIVTLFYLVHVDNLRDMPALSRQIAEYAKNSSWDRYDLLKPLIVMIIGGFPMFVRFVIFRRPRDQEKVQLNRAAVTFVIFWLLLETIGVVAQRRMYAYHFMVIAPPLALLYGLLPRRDRFAPLAAALIPTCIFSVYGASLLIGRGYQGRIRLADSDYLAAHAKTTDAVWMDDSARLLLETGMQPGSRILLPFLFANSDRAGLDYSERIIRDFELRLPEYVILRGDFDKMLDDQGREILELNRFPVRRANFVIGWRRIRAYVQANYVKEIRLEHDEIYRRVHS